MSIIFYFSDAHEHEQQGLPCQRVRGVLEEKGNTFFKSLLLRKSEESPT